MKKSKISAVLVAACILLTSILGTFTVSAETTDYQNKLDSQLKEKINSSNETDLISTYIFLYPCTNRTEVERIVNEKYTWTTVDEFLYYYRHEYASICDAYVQQFIDDNSEFIGEILFQGPCEFLIVKTTKDSIIELAKNDVVDSLNYYADAVLFDDDDEDDDDDDSDAYLCTFVSWSKSKYGENCLANGYSYNELSKQTNWVLVEAKYLSPEPEAETWVHIGGRHIMSDSLCAPFKCGYGVYDVNESRFYDLDEISGDYSKYNGLIETLEALKIGNPTGDADLDNTVSISDATCIQKSLAGLCQFTSYQNGLSDVDKNGEVTIDDATTIQMYLAQLITGLD